MEQVALIVYGDGKELGNFKIFANSLKKDLNKKYNKVIIQYANRDKKFFEIINSINSTKEKIAELHIFSHAIGAGLFLGYKDPIIAASRKALVFRARKKYKKVKYLQAVNIEIGAIQTDDFKLDTLKKKKLIYQKKFTKSAFIKIWGCNSGVKGWVYSDTNNYNRDIVDPDDTSALYYWRAFNERNTPKPSIAQAMATFFNRKVYGAKSGSHIIVKHNKKWISSKQYKDKIGHWPSGKLPHQLIPDKGTYHEYLP